MLKKYYKYNNLWRYFNNKNEGTFYKFKDKFIYINIYQKLI